MVSFWSIFSVAVILLIRIRLLFPAFRRDITAYTYVVAQTEEGEPGNIFRCEPFEVKESNLGTMDDLFPDANSQNGTASVALSSVGKMRPTTVGAMKVVSVL